MDELLRQAIERRNVLRKELEALDRFIADYAPVVSPVRRNVPLPKANDLFSRKRGSRAERAAAVSAMMDEAEKLILAAGRPLTRSTLLKSLEEAGHKVEGGDKSKVLGTNLWRSHRFDSIVGAGYWPRNTERPPRFRDLPTRDTKAG